MIISLPLGLALLLVQPAPVARGAERGLAEAAALMQSGRLDQAEEKLQALLRVSPRNANALNLLGIVRGEQNRVEEAGQLFRRALAINPLLSGAAVNLGYLFRKIQRGSDALAAFQQADRIQPGDPEIRFNIAALRADAGEFAAALSLLEKIASRDRSPEYPVVEARCLIGLQRLAELRDRLPSARAALEPFPPLLAEYAQMLIAARLADEAVTLLKGVGSPAAESFPVTFNLGEALQLTGDLDGAAAVYRKALAAEPRSVESLRRLSVIAQSQGQWQEMFDHLGQARKLAPNSASILHGFALAALRTGHYGDAQFSIHQALNLEPDRPDFLYLLGVTQMSFSDIPAALETFRKYTKLKPSDPLGHLALGSAFYESAQFEEATQALNRSRQLDDRLVEPLYYLGMIGHRQGDQATSLDLLTRVVDREPRHAGALAGLGAVYLKAGDLVRAQQTLERAIELRPEHATTHYQLSQVLVRLNQSERAEQELKLYTELKAKAEEARESASRLLGSPPVKH